ncbi:MAG TPA: tetratricopeptide repeat protein [candidate division WOR-3 bacterium]|uniref:Tetratricopeptide repeat protein n=1 Tax=candidate division WOR-3 bacterium TaxID=2052148 RepID=A0A9C9ENM5_UNCW3|nr:tetratricopeptide repeat protein [candidate division WOR-3 bacterium]
MVSILIILTALNSNITAADLYNEGNRAYEKGDYKTAVEKYEEAALRIRNSDLYYNLGNSYFKAGNIGKAIVNYRRAYFLNPRDGDIKHNLAFVRRYRVDKINIIESPITKFFSALFHFLTITEAQNLAAFSFFLTAVLVSLFLIMRKKIYGYAAMVTVISFFFFLINWQIWRRESISSDAVVVVPEVTAFSGPGDEYKEILVIHDGAEVKIREIRNNYALVQLPGGIGGWVDLNGFEKIFPLPTSD